MALNFTTEHMALRGALYSVRPRAQSHKKWKVIGHAHETCRYPHLLKVSACCSHRGRVLARCAQTLASNILVMLALKLMDTAALPLLHCGLHQFPSVRCSLDRGNGCQGWAVMIVHVPIKGLGTLLDRKSVEKLPLCSPLCMEDVSSNRGTS